MTTKFEVTLVLGARGILTIPIQTEFGFRHVVGTACDKARFEHEVKAAEIIEIVIKRIG